AGVLVIILVAERRAEATISVKRKILRTQTLPDLVVRFYKNDSLPAAQDRKVGTILRVEPQPRVVKIVTHVERRAPVDDPSFFRTEAVVDFLRGLADIHTINKSGDGHEARSDVVIGTVIGEM